MQKVKLFWSLVLAACLLSCKGQVETERKVSMTAPVVKYKDMHSGYRDPDGARMEAFLQCWKKQTVQWAEANNMQKAGEAAQGRYQGKGAEQLPLSVANFWRAAKSTDWISIYDVKKGRRFFEPQEIKLFKDKDPGHFRVLTRNEDDFSVPDRDYYIYNNLQNSPVSTPDISAYWVYGEEADSVFYGEIRREKSVDGECQFIFYGPHGPVIRFKSFAHMLVNFYLEEYQFVKRRDESMGHIYYFDGDWGRTCVPLLFDADEIASWQVGS